MHTCFDAYIVYGFSEGNREDVLDATWLYDNFPEIYIYALDVVKGHLGEACYGITCGLNVETGEIIIEPDSKEKVKKFYDKFVKLYPEKQVQLGYYRALQGDYDKECHHEYSLADEEENGSEEDETEEYGTDEDETEEEKDDYVSEEIKIKATTPVFRMFFKTQEGFNKYSI